MVFLKKIIFLATWRDVKRQSSIFPMMILQLNQNKICQEKEFAEWSIWMWYLVKRYSYQTEIMEKKRTIKNDNFTIKRKKKQEDH